MRSSRPPHPTIMPDTHASSLTFPVKDAIDVTVGIRRVREAGMLSGATEMDQILVATIISELGTNIVKYARRGTIRVRRVQAIDGVDVDIWAEDSGPGIADVDRAMQDHFSTGNTLGLGLPGVRRMADAFEIDSTAEHGTKVHARKRILGRRTAAPQIAPAIRDAATAARLSTSQWDVGMCVRPMAGYVVSGDMAAALEIDGGLLLVIADGTGHGIAANEVAQSLSRFLHERATSDLKRLLTEMHTLLRSTVGAAVGAMFVDAERRTLRYVGVGNTGAARRVGASWRPISKDGVLGQRLPTLLEQASDLSRGDLIMLWSDGLSELAGGMFAVRNAYKPATQLAAELVAELGKPHDDASCIVLRWLN